MAKQISSVEAEYRKERNRIKRFMRNAEKRGYNFDENALPPKPKTITQASVNRLKKLTPEKLYAKSTAEVTTLSPDTGQVETKTVKGTTARKVEKARASKVSWVEPSGKQENESESKQRKGVDNTEKEAPKKSPSRARKGSRSNPITSPEQGTLPVISTKNIIRERLNNLREAGDSKGQQIFDRVIGTYIDKFGEDDVINSIDYLYNMNDEILDDIEDALNYGEGESQDFARTIRALSSAIIAGHTRQSSPKFRGFTDEEERDVRNAINELEEWDDSMEILDE